MNLLDLCKNLVKFKSISPNSAGSIEFLSNILSKNAFECHLLEFGENKIMNLYAEFTNGSGPNVCFAGHTDVVPPGNLENWNSDPFNPFLKNGYIYGRGVCDMKSAIASYIFSVLKFIKYSKEKFQGKLSLIITADEEGDADFGTKKVVEWLKKNNRNLDFCIVGEPTNPNFLGEMVKIGRRGSINGEILIRGVQGHVAYPEKATNPIDGVIKVCNELQVPFDKGTEYFQPSNLVITSIDVGNKISNIIPSEAKIQFNVRFNDNFNSKEIKKIIEKRISSKISDYEVSFKVSGESFINNADKLTQALINSIKKIENKDPQLSTNGGTSDARFISELCPVIEFGLVGKTMHQANENSSIRDIENLSQIYFEFLKNIFSTK